MRSNEASGRGVLLMPITLMPKALARFARSVPMMPTPRMATVLPNSLLCWKRSQTARSWFLSMRG